MMKKQKILNSAIVLTAVLLVLYPAASLPQQNSTPAQTVPLTLAAQNAPKALPDGPGKDTFVRVCSKCHSTDIPAAQHKSADDWTNTLIDMRNKGAEASDEEMEQILKYLVTNFGPVK
jgi:competence protein ComEA